jgi:hypothetical protein
MRKIATLYLNPATMFWHVGVYTRRLDVDTGSCQHDSIGGLAARNAVGWVGGPLAQAEQGPTAHAAR